MSDSPDHSSREAGSSNRVKLKDVFAPDRIQIGVEVTNLKKMIDELAGLLVRSSTTDLDRNTVFRTLLKRERIGSTWVTEDVAIPHCRFAGITESVGAILRLSSPICVDETDKKYVRVACGLLVPEDQAGGHLQVLSGLARAFSNHDLYSRLVEAQDEQDMYDQLSKIESEFDGGET